MNPVQEIVELVPDSHFVQRAMSVVNGSFGERADLTGGGSPTWMTVRVEHARVDLDRESLAVAYPGASGRIVVFLHGLIETERCWFHQANSHRHRTGRHVSGNGRTLVRLLSDLVSSWPVPVTEIVLIGHSMGGLVARSALHQATGAPLERHVARATAVLNRFVITAVLARLLELRSDGIKDLGRGYLRERQWLAVPAGTGEAVEARLTGHLRQYFLAATLSRSEHGILGRLVGDLMVGPASAADQTQIADRGWLGGIHHFDLIHHDDACDAMLTWLTATRPGAASRDSVRVGSR